MLSVDHITFKYKDQNTLNDISFQLKKGSHLAVMGESGCGKSTLLKAIYGLLDLESGSICYQEEELFGPEQHLVPGHPFMKFLTQELNIMPFTSVFENVAEHLSRFDMEAREKRALELIEVVDLSQYKDTKVMNLSGGQKQRVALAKVLSKEPEVLLLDEPFSQIDHFRKNELRYRLFHYLKEKSISCITATHDRNDVLPLADELMIMREGKVVAHNTPKYLYENPSDVYSASLFSEVNVVPAIIFNPKSPKMDTILYPNEIFITEKEKGVIGVVTQCYFQGNGYLLKIALEDYQLTIQHPFAIRHSTKVKLVCNADLVLKRVNI